MKRWALLSGCGIVVLAGLLAWREWSHAAALGAWSLEGTRQREVIAGQEAELSGAQAQLEAAEAGRAELERTAESLRDRATNLEAQRDHLRAETDRQAERARLADAQVEGLRTELEEARQQVLEQSALPRELRAQLEEADGKICELEERLDKQAGQRSDFPETLEVAGVASDGAVFALSGPLPRETILPVSVYVVRRNAIQLEGWINRIENGVAIGHVEQWRDPVSTLVKGEKVFILPRQRHEADP